MIPTDVTELGESSLVKIAGLAELGWSSEAEIRQVIVGAATIMETYVDAILADLFLTSDLNRLRLGTAMLRKIDSDAGQTWKSRNQWFSAASGTGFSDKEFGRKASVVVDLRNALAHGSGGISPNQRRADDSGLGIRRSFRELLNVDTGAEPLLLRRSTARAVVVITREFVLGVDAIVRRVPPGGPPN